MKNKLLKVAISACMMGICSTVLTAQDYGLGLEIEDNAPLIRGIINIENDMRIEPYLAFGTTSSSGVANSNSVSFNGNTASGTLIQAGSALHWLQHINKNVQTYYGGHFGLIYSDFGNSSDIGVQVGAVAGAEYFLGQHFSLGGEIELAAVMLDASTAISTNSGAILRYYFQSKESN